MKDRWLVFVLGVMTGYLGAVMYRRLHDGTMEEDAERIREKLSDSVSTLEKRISAVLDVAKSDAPA